MTPTVAMTPALAVSLRAGQSGWELFRTQTVALQIVLVTLLVVLLDVPARPQQTCNPVIDGTYCATQPSRHSTDARSRVGLRPIQGLGSDLSSRNDQPATLGSITFRGGGTQCIGLLRRGACN